MDKLTVKSKVVKHYFYIKGKNIMEHDFVSVKILEKDHQDIRAFAYHNQIKHYEVVGFALNALRLELLNDQEQNHPLFQLSSK